MFILFVATAVESKLLNWTSILYSLLTFMSVKLTSVKVSFQTQSFKITTFHLWNLNCSIFTSWLQLQNMLQHKLYSRIYRCRLFNNYEWHAVNYQCSTIKNKHSLVQSVALNLKKILHSSFYHSLSVPTCPTSCYCSTFPPASPWWPCVSNHVVCLSHLPCILGCFYLLVFQTPKAFSARKISLSSEYSFLLSTFITVH